MGFILLLKLMAKNFDVLAWPLITVVYPLYASIWAIENSSNSDNRKCLTYWVIYSLIWLFRFSFAKLIQWLPLWPYVKLMAACCLVLPHLDGAAYVYDHFVRPCFPVIMQMPNSWFIQQKEDILLSRPNDFLIAAETYIKENGHEALDKLVNMSKCKEPNLARTVIKAVATTENNETTTAEWVKLDEPNIDWTEKKIFPVPENKEVEAAATVYRGSELPDLPAPVEVQKEWTCSLCQVSASCKENLKQHFRGQKHQAKQQELKASKMAAKSEGSSTSRAKRAKKPKVEPKKGESANGPNQKRAKKKEVKVNESSEKWTFCHKCNVMCGAKATWLSHLNGKKHLTKVNQLAQ